MKQGHLCPSRMLKAKRPADENVPFRYVFTQTINMRYQYALHNRFPKPATPPPRRAGWSLPPAFSPSPAGWAEARPGQARPGTFSFPSASRAHRLCPPQLCQDLQLIPFKPSGFPGTGEHRCFPSPPEALPDRETNSSASPRGRFYLGMEPSCLDPFHTLLI